MIIKQQLKIKYKVEELISFIEQHETEKVQKILEIKPELLYEKGMDENPPIIYSIRYSNIESFKLMLNLYKRERLDRHKIYEILGEIISFAGTEFFTHLISSLNIGINSLEKSTIHKILRGDNLDIIDYMLNQSNFNYSVKISDPIYKKMGYNSHKFVSKDYTLHFNQVLILI